MKITLVFALTFLGLTAACDAPSLNRRAEAALGCGDNRCRSNADCPSNCGPCIEWSGTCALFQPR